ncbi:uncharacterized protein LOC103709088 isoform X4 [Phoenix dactylifera]|uniref:Uncharacterized protein LOC103709088 isoform X4 n=1 Tax=Phoenix dactylifera TaxID=42345 RepID=A0A8B8J5Z0_PHODC|nr:uncharacterized protein LOC103709088 isoform X4 [Phoenix dactylifera]
MPGFSSYLGSRIRSFLRDYDRLQSLAVILIYIQIGCALVGSLGALYNGVLLINLVVALFALVAIESSSQSLGRTYAVLLFFAILLDIAWFVLFSHTIWNITPDEKLGVSSVDGTAYHEADFDVRNSFLNPSTHEVDRQTSNSDDILGGSIYDPAYYSSLFEDAPDKSCACEFCLQGDKPTKGRDGGSSAVESPQLKSCISRSFQVDDVDNML